MGTMSLLDQIQKTSLRRISTNGGDVLHAMKSSEGSFHGFGEAYFTWVDSNVVKAWKQHFQMTMNLVVPVGEVRFVFYDPASAFFREELIGEQHYHRLTVPPRIWFGFQGKAKRSSLILNLANLSHSPEEVMRIDLEKIQFDWISEQ